VFFVGRSLLALQLYHLLVVTSPVSVRLPVLFVVVWPPFGGLVLASFYACSSFVFLARVWEGFVPFLESFALPVFSPL
jgi:hypothetical protein